MRSLPTSPPDPSPIEWASAEPNGRRRAGARTAVARPALAAQDRRGSSWDAGYNR